VTRARALAGLLVALAAALPNAAAAQWRPPDVRAASTSLGDVLRAYATAAGTPDARYAQRRERWTYAVRGRRLAVAVAVRDADFRANVDLDGHEYAGGRSSGTRWRADANGIAHATLSDDQGDAADRLPQSVFPFATSDCVLAGESTRFGPAWVLLDRAPHDKPHWLYVDAATGRIAHEITREGARTIVTSFDRFEPMGTMVRPRRWHVSDGDAAHDLDVTVDAIEPGAPSALDVAPPQHQRVFTAPSAERGVVTLPTVFRGPRIWVDVDVDGEHRRFVLDTGTASITLSAEVAERRRWSPLLEHASVPHMRAGALQLDDVSTLTIPTGGFAGILGYDFFLGHVVHVDYANRRVEVMTGAAAETPFHDPSATVIDASFDEGIPLVHAAFGAASGDRFTLDTGSPHLFVLAPFTRRWAGPVAEWTPSTFGRRGAIAAEDYLEGSIVVAARTAPAFTLGPARFADLLVGIEQPNSRANAIDIALDGIVGTDEMSRFDWWFDYDRGRIAMRRNGLR
jgi:hypothetical protein